MNVIDIFITVTITIYHEWKISGIKYQIVTTCKYWYYVFENSKASRGFKYIEDVLNSNK